MIRASVQQCSVCLQTLPITDYWIDRQTRQRACKMCMLKRYAAPPYAHRPGERLCAQCRAPIPRTRPAWASTCSRACTLARVGLWPTFDANDAAQVEVAVIVLDATAPRSANLARETREVLAAVVGAALESRR